MGVHSLNNVQNVIQNPTYQSLLKMVFLSNSFHFEEQGYTTLKKNNLIYGAVSLDLSNFHFDHPNYARLKLASKEQPFSFLNLQTTYDGKIGGLGLCFN